MLLAAWLWSVGKGSRNVSVGRMGAARKWRFLAGISAGREAWVALGAVWVSGIHFIQSQIHTISSGYFVQLLCDGDFIFITVMFLFLE